LFIIGIAGASGSGKTLLCKTLLTELSNELGDNQIGILKEDSYYRDLSHLSLEQRHSQNYDHPDAFEHDLLEKHLQLLKQGSAIEVPLYSYQSYTRVSGSEFFSAPKILLLEGILMLHNRPLRDLMDLKIFVSTALDISFIRRLKRDIEKRGRTLESVIDQYNTTTRPMYYQFVRPSQEHADVIVPHGGRNRQAIDTLKARIRELITT
jgi:uridine kinase